VIKLDSPEDALPLALSLKSGGLCCAEITFRTDAAAEAIELIAKAHPDFLLIAGTVLTQEQVKRAISAGAQAIVSPGLNPAVVAYCISNGIPVIPGVCTPSEIETGLSMGLEYLKFFPAEAAGGVKMIKAVSAPYTRVKFMPTGGINAANIADYLALRSVFACGGSWMATEKLINERRFDEITALTAQAVAAVREARK
ncbi:MAG: bifunctional 4-hydroxy-2-oxoglutarate aldolase/2-dehydro-3-deoxy-phosphogluconate aldolase, partial [Clostridia bacterium]|nr:bifunctional 4-hydroxy-2-oxoglutarate aldolase/2-dehydro-3-deoxy-phosphogluconate aldolase [Clostridia bacterium]